MATVEIVDRSEMIEKMKALLEINPKETAIVTVDMHRGHLDPALATMPASPEDCARVIRATERLLEHARAAGVPVIHVVTVQRLIPGLGAEGRACPLKGREKKSHSEQCYYSAAARPTAHRNPPKRRGSSGESLPRRDASSLGGVSHQLPPRRTRASPFPQLWRWNRTATSWCRASHAACTT